MMYSGIEENPLHHISPKRFNHFPRPDTKTPLSGMTEKAARSLARSVYCSDVSDAIFPAELLQFRTASHQPELMKLPAGLVHIPHGHLSRTDALPYHRLLRLWIVGESSLLLKNTHGLPPDPGSI